MKTLIFLITIIAAASLVRAGENEEIIWETEQIGGINDVLVSPLGEIFYNVTGSTIQIRSIEDGTLIDYFIPDDMPNHITHISITDDGRYMAISGDNPHIVIYDLQEKMEVKRLTTAVWEEEKYGENKVYQAEQWVSSSISPDGTKVTGVAISDFGVKKSSFIIIDIETEEILHESRRQLYDRDIQKPDNFEWISSEFTADGNYIVSQLDYEYYHGDETDSIYIHDANTLEVYDVVLNLYGNDANDVNLSSNKNTFTYKPKANTPIHIYNISSKETFQTNIDPYIWTFTFLKNSENIIYGHSDGLRIYDYQNDKPIYDYKLVTNVFTTSLDDSKLLANYHGHVYCLKTFINETSVEKKYADEITISPNPTDDFLNINTELIIDDIEVLNIEGKLMFTTDEKLIDISQLSSGVYYLVIKSGKQTVTKQFNVVR